MAPLVVAIGSGPGDAVVHGALTRPGTNFLAVEVYRPGLAATVGKISRHDLTNVRLVQADAVQVLKHMLGQGSAAEIWVFFADPWHKNRHRKGRMVNAGFAERAAPRPEPGRTLRVAAARAGHRRPVRHAPPACPPPSQPTTGQTTRPTQRPHSTTQPVFRSASGS